MCPNRRPKPSFFTSEASYVTNTKLATRLNRCFGRARRRGGGVNGENAAAHGGSVHRLRPRASGGGPGAGQRCRGRQGAPRPPGRGRQIGLPRPLWPQRRQQRGHSGMRPRRRDSGGTARATATRKRNPPLLGCGGRRERRHSVAHLVPAWRNDATCARVAAARRADGRVGRRALWQPAPASPVDRRRRAQSRKASPRPCRRGAAAVRTSL